MKHLKRFNEAFGFNKNTEPWVESDGEWKYDVNLPKTYIPCIIRDKNGKETEAYLEYNKSPFRYYDKKDMTGDYIWVAKFTGLSSKIGLTSGRRDTLLDDVVAWRYKNPGGVSDWQMDYDKKYKRKFESSEHFSLTDKYEELSDDVLLQKTGDDEWLERTPNHIKLLSLLVHGIDADIADYFLLDDRFFNSLENEYRYTGYRLTRDEVKDACYKLKEEGYLK